MINENIGIISAGERYIAILKRCANENNMNVCVYDMNSIGIKGDIEVALNYENYRNAISSDGEYVAIALYEDFKPGHIFIYSLSDRTCLNDIRSFRRMEWIRFENNKLLVGENNYTYEVDFITGNILSKERMYDRIHNEFGEVIVEKTDNRIIYNNLSVKSNTFSFISVIGVPYGVVASEVAGDIVYIGNHNENRWRISLNGLGHAISLYYSRNLNLLLAEILNPHEVSERFHIAVIDCVKGCILSVFVIKTTEVVFLEQEEKTLMVDKNGDIFEVMKYEIKYMKSLF